MIRVPVACWITVFLDLVKNGTVPAIWIALIQHDFGIRLRSDSHGNLRKCMNETQS